LGRLIPLIGPPNSAVRQLREFRTGLKWNQSLGRSDLAREGPE
jgi:hypothetical protein